MAELTKSTSMVVSSKIEDKKNFDLTRMMETLESNRIGLFIMFFTVIACAGGLVAAFHAYDSLLGLSAVALSTVMVEAMVLSVAPLRIVILAFVSSILIDLLVLVF